MSTKNVSGTVTQLPFESSRRAGAPPLDAPPSDTLRRPSPDGEHERLLHVVEAVADLVAIVDSAGRVTYINPAGRALMGIGDAEPVSNMCLSDLHPAGIEKDLEYVALPAAVRDGVWIGESALLTRSSRDIAVSEMLIVRKAPDGRLDSVTVVMRDIRKRKRREESLRQSEARFRTLVETMTEGVVVMDRHGMIGFVNERFSVMMGCSPSDLIGRAFDDFLDPAQRGPRPAQSAGGGADDNLAFESTLTHANGQIVPIRVSVRRMDSAVAGVEGSCAIVSSLAVKPAVVWKSVQDRHRLSSQIVAAQEAERKRIASDLHDGLGQSLSAVKFALEQAVVRLGNNEIDEATRLLGGLLSKVRHTIDDVRQVAMNLRPSTLDDLGILATLSWFLREFESTYGTITVDKWFGISEGDVPDALKVTLFRVVQEAMNNIAKHAHATRVGICIQKDGDELRMTIVDNGVGFEPRELASQIVPGMGLGRAGLRDRVEMSGGKLAIDAAHGKGVCLRMWWPLREQAAGDDPHVPRGPGP